MSLFWRSEDDWQWIQYQYDCCGAVCSGKHGKALGVTHTQAHLPSMQIIPTSLVFTSSDSIHILFLFSWGMLPSLQISAASLHLSISVSFPLSLSLSSPFHPSSFFRTRYVTLKLNLLQKQLTCRKNLFLCIGLENTAHKLTEYHLMTAVFLPLMLEISCEINFSLSRWCIWRLQAVTKIYIVCSWCWMNWPL